MACSSDTSSGPWNARYAAAQGYLFGTAPAGFLVREAPRLAPGSRVLCVADGEGRNSVHLATLGHKVTAMDASDIALEKARALALARGVKVDYRHAGVEGWNWEAGRWDAVVAVFVQFADPALRARMFAGFRRTLAPGGLLLLHGYTPEQIAHGTGGPDRAENLYTEALLREAFAGLGILRLAAYEAVIEEGTGHAGRSALIDLVARKPG